MIAGARQSRYNETLRLLGRLGFVFGWRVMQALGVSGNLDCSVVVAFA